MLHAQKAGKNIRLSYAKIKEALEMPNLIEIQRDSYRWFLEEGLKEVFDDVSPITDHAGKFALEFVDYNIDYNPTHTVEECKERDAKYESKLKVKVRLTNRETGESMEKDDIYIGALPLMTEQGTFIINGAERVIVSQLVRSPGIYFESSIDKNGKHLYKAQIIPYRGAWIEYETEATDVFSVRLDRTRKLPMTVLLKALQDFDTPERIRDAFGYDEDKIEETLKKDETDSSDSAVKEIYKKLRPGELASAENARSLVENMLFDPKRYDLAYVGRYKYNKKLEIRARIKDQILAQPVADPRTGEIMAEAGVKVSAALADAIDRAGVNEVIVDVDGKEVKVFSNDMVYLSEYVDFDVESLDIKSDKVRRSILEEIIEGAEGDEEIIKEQIVARFAELSPKHITKEDIYASINYCLNLSYGIGTCDDIDHLGNRRLRCVGELLQNQVRIGITRMERTVRERMSTQETSVMTPQSLINIRPIIAAINEFFGSSQLSQFMDQPNPLAELRHKRRISALGPGGLSRERAGFEVRDIHYSHYGRMCPIETPEGPNIGLITSLATFARVNQYGFIEAPYRKVIDGRVTDEIEYMTADIEDGYIIAQANEPLSEDGAFLSKKVTARHREDIVEVSPDKIDYMDVSPRQLVSVVTACIPFLENDDANRALMGSNMQCQAVPLLTTDSPIVGTGIEHKVAKDSGSAVLSKATGVVSKVDADRVVIVDDNGIEYEHKLIKFARSNQSTCINQRPIVEEGERVKRGDIIVDGPAMDNGELALGKNILIGFMTWEGYNYEDAVLISEELVKNDVFTSIHMEEYECEARENPKLGAEEITRDIPNVSDDALKNLDEDGIIRVGAEVRAGDILVGKVTPKGETERTPEERLLHAIFGDKAREVRDTSLRVPHGESGIIVAVKKFTKEDADEFAPLAPGVNESVVVYIAQKRKISVGDKMAGRHGNKGVVSRVLPQEDMPFLEDGTPLQIVLNPLGVPSRMNIGQVLEMHLGYAYRCLSLKTREELEKITSDNFREAVLAAKDAARPGRFIKIATPVFDGAQDSDIQEAFKEAGLNETYKSVVYDGRTGEKFDNPVTVGIMYYLKLHHLVDDKIHARSTGPYSLVTQQPLGGKAQFGGQRFGEMEVWALEAYGAAYTLQEILTVKSDDIVGRVKAYEAIVKGENIPKSGIPESFKVLVKELQSLALDIRILDRNMNEIDLNASFESDDTTINEEYRAIAEGDDAAQIMSEEAETMEGMTMVGDDIIEEDIDDENM